MYLMKYKLVCGISRRRHEREHSASARKFRRFFFCRWIKRARKCTIRVARCESYRLSRDAINPLPANNQGGGEFFLQNTISITNSDISTGSLYQCPSLFGGRCANLPGASHKCNLHDSFRGPLEYAAQITFHHCARREISLKPEPKLLDQQTPKTLIYQTTITGDILLTIHV